MDAYSYIQRGHVFANAQTGNILLFGVHISQLHFLEALQYAIPVLAFAFGIGLATLLPYKDMKKLHWRQIALVFEMVILFSVAFFKPEANLLANSLTSLACGIQVETFRKIQGLTAATTMCIGNLKSGTEHICHYMQTKKKHHLEKGCFYYFMISCFTLGAILGNIFVQWMHQYAIWICISFLFTAFLIMFIDLENKKD